MLQDATTRISAKSVGKKHVDVDTLCVRITHTMTSYQLTDILYIQPHATEFDLIAITYEGRRNAKYKVLALFYSHTSANQENWNKAVR